MQIIDRQAMRIRGQYNLATDPQLATGSVLCGAGLLPID